MRLQYTALIALVAGCTSPTAPHFGSELPVAFANRISECGGTPGDPFPGVDPAVWASAPDSIVLGRVSDVRLVDAPLARFRCGAGPEPDPPGATCDGTISEALQLTLDENAEVLRGVDVGRTLLIGASVVDGFLPHPEPTTDGSIEWTPRDRLGRIEVDQVLILPVWRHDVLGVAGPAGTAMLLVDEGGIVHVQKMAQPECEWLTPADVDGEALEEVRERLSAEPAAAQVDQIEELRAIYATAIELGQDDGWAPSCNGSCP